MKKERKEDEKRLLAERMSGAKVFRIIRRNGMVKGAGHTQWLIRTKKSKRHKIHTNEHANERERSRDMGCKQARNERNFDGKL